MARLGPWGVAAWLVACGGGDGGGGGGGDGTPEPARYAVRGTVSGLSGELTLQLNGQERLARTADGPFAFQTSLADQTDYAVTVLTPPAEQDCTVEGGTGRVAGTDVASVRVRCAVKTYPLGGTVEGARGAPKLRLGSETLSLTPEGRFGFTTRLPRGAAYTVELVDVPASLRCTLSRAAGSVTGPVDDISVRCIDWYTLSTHQPASGVLGQADFTHRQANRGQGSTTAGTLNTPQGNPVVVAGRLYVTDQNAHRLLGFSEVPTTPGAEAAFVLGQTDLTSAGIGSGLTGLGQPGGLSADATRLAVADQRNSRVLFYAPLPTTTATAPTRVLGQSGFDTTAYGCGPGGLNFPQDVFIGRGKVLVADSANNRVLVWNSVPRTNGQPADLVLGQQSFTVCRRNDADGDGRSDSRPGPTTLNNPTGVWTDGTRLVVVDNYNNRVLLWNTFPTTHGQPADVVLGQAAFDTNAAALSATGMNNPATVTSTGQQLFVTDTLNHRVLVWNALPTRSTTPPDTVLGQADFTHADTVDAASGGPSERSLQEPGGVTLAWPHVIVSDSRNHRVLLFPSP